MEHTFVYFFRHFMFLHLILLPISARFFIYVTGSKLFLKTSMEGKIIGDKKLFFKIQIIRMIDQWLAIAQVKLILAIYGTVQI